MKPRRCNKDGDSDRYGVWLCIWEAETDTYSVVPHYLPRCTFVFLGYWIVTGWHSYCRVGEVIERYNSIALVADGVPKRDEERDVSGEQSHEEEHWR